MILQLALVLIFVVTTKCSVNNQGILFQISSGKNVCNKETLFRNFSFNDIPQFEAMCNIPVPKENQANFLLETNVIPILCMGLYDVAIRFCKEKQSSTEDYLSEIFPPTSNKFVKIFDTLEHNQNYSNLTWFCSKTINSNMIINASNEYSAFWWELLHKQFKDNCLDICRTHKNNRVNPLCSFIIWSNEVHSKNTTNKSSSLSDEESIKFSSDDSKNTKKAGFEPKLQLTKSGNHPDTSNIKNDPNTSALNSTNVGLVQPVNQITYTSIPLKSENNVDKFTKSNLYANNLLQNVSFDNSFNEQILASTETPMKTLVIPNKDDLSLREHLTIKTPSISNKQKTEELPKAAKKIVDDNLLKKQEENSLLSSQSPKENENKDAILVGTGDETDREEKISIDNETADQLESGQAVQKQLGEDPDNEFAIDEDNEGQVTEKSGANQGDLKTKKTNNPDLNEGKADNFVDSERTVLIEDPFIEEEDSHFFTYFIFMTALTILACLAFHNKKKLLALVLEGRRSRSTRRRPNSSNYSKLDCSLEEAMGSNTTASVTHVHY